jgi:3-isopropylmalate/(R)-2-methylmalate dehydratase small subunit
MLSNINGRVAWVFEEDNFDIDMIVGVENIKVSNIEVLKAVCMKKYDEDFSKNVKPGDVIVGGKNFGYGHPHYTSFKALRALGISAVFAESFAPGFYRGETTNGFALIECPGILKLVKRWDEVSFDWDTSELTVNGKNSIKCFVPKKTKELIECGGIINYLREKRL